MYYITTYRIFAVLFLIPILCSAFSVERFIDNPENVIDMTYRFKENETLYWPGQPKFKIVEEKEFHILESGEYYFRAKEFSGGEHGGTHIDAPAHFGQGKWSVHEIPIEQMMGPGVMIDVSNKSNADPLHLVKIRDITSWEIKHGTIPEGAVVLINTGRGKYWPDETKYFGKVGNQLRFPGMDPYAAAWLVKNRKIVGVGIDTPSIDNGISKTFGSHVELSKASIYIIENVANLDKLPSPTGFTIFALPMKLYEGTGAPTRVVALLGDPSSSCRPTTNALYLALVVAILRIIELIQ